eukprot:5140011-Prymnesium_polylepis.1
MLGSSSRERCVTGSSTINDQRRHGVGARGARPSDGSVTRTLRTRGVAQSDQRAHATDARHSDRRGRS